MYKINRFHYLVKHKPQNVLYNTLTGSLMWVNDIFVEKFSKLISNTSISDELLNEIFKDEKVVDKLKKEGIVIPTNYDELATVKKYQEILWFEDTSTNVEFIVTYACNLKCNYCYAIRKNKMMTPEIACSSADFVIDFAKKRQSKEMMVQFIGGEPLLNTSIIEIIVDKMIKFKNQKSIKMKTSLTTNGILLNKKSIDSIRRLGPIQVQITIDGPEEIHNKRRFLSGGNSFKVIINNIIKFKQNIDELVIRVNIDYENIEYIPDLLQQLYDYGLVDASLTMIPTFSHTEQCSHYHSYCFTEKDIPSKIRKVWSIALDLGFNLGWSPMPTFISCGAVSPSNLAIDPYGDIYKCAAAYGDKIHVIGNIFNGIDSSSNSLYESYINRDNLILKNEECKECRSLPICKGGCNFRAERRTGSMSAPDCRFDKSDCIEDFIRLYADWYTKNESIISPKIIFE